MHPTQLQPGRRARRPSASAATLLGLALALSVPAAGSAVAGELDEITGTAGNDHLRGTPAVDDIRGGAGSDRLWGYAGDDVLSGGPGRDSLRGGRGADRLEGGSGDDVLSGGRGGDHLVGGAGVDTVESEVGRDRIHLGAGDDSYVDWQVDGLRDEIWCGPGVDFVGYWGDPDPADTLHGCEDIGNIAH